MAAGFLPAAGNHPGSMLHICRCRSLHIRIRFYLAVSMGCLLACSARVGARTAVCIGTSNRRLPGCAGRLPGCGCRPIRGDYGSIRGNYGSIRGDYRSAGRRHNFVLCRNRLRSSLPAGVDRGPLRSPCGGIGGCGTRPQRMSDTGSVHTCAGREPRAASEADLGG